MHYILLGCIAFLFLYLFDIAKVKRLSPIFNINFLIGCALLAYSTLKLLTMERYAGVPPVLYLRVIFFGLSVVCLALMIYSLFFALPFGGTYVKGRSGTKVIDTGMYALCRHPGVLWFFLFYLFLWLYSGRAVLFWGCLVFSAMDVLHVYVQDRFLFEKTLESYPQYRLTTPFLLPTRASVVRCLSTLKIPGMTSE